MRILIAKLFAVSIGVVLVSLCALFALSQNL